MTYFFNAEEIFHVAIMIEENGEKFYNHLQSAFRDENVRQVCERLATEEHKHKLLFEKLITEVVNKRPAVLNLKDFNDEDLKYLKALADSNVFADSFDIRKIAGKIGTAKEAINLALNFEKDSIFFFVQMKSLTSPESGKDDIDRLIEQEQTHVKILTLLLGKL